MSALDKLKKLLLLCKCGVYVEVNKHRDYYETAEEELNGLAKQECPPEIGDETRKKMIETNTIINIHFYPRTPISFYSVYHYDLDKALDEALACLQGDAP
jgi:hypothetical protein